MSNELTLDQLDRIIANHESVAQLTGVNVYRQLAAVTLERDALADALRNSSGYLRSVSWLLAQEEMHRPAQRVGSMAKESEDTLDALKSGELRR